jgi:thioredoxin 1
MGVVTLTSGNFEEEVKKSDKIVIVDFYADWCGPCKMMSPIIDKVAEELGDAVKVGKVNSDDNMELAVEYGIMSIPTIMFFKGGEVVKVFNGLTSKSELLDAIKEL